MLWQRLATTASAALICCGLQSAQAQDLIISSSLPQSHMWVSEHMEPFIAALEQASGGKISFTAFANGELTSVGRELDALQSGTIQVAAPLLAPYHEGAFPLSDVTQLPTYGTDSPMVTRAFQKLLDSDVVLKDGKTFYDYEIASKGIRAWPIGATSAYVISTTGSAPHEPAALKGMPLRAGSAIHTMFLNEIGATPVTMPAVSVFEALSRGTVSGLVLSIADWSAYSLEPVIKDSITDLAVGHWESYLAISEDGWNQLDAEAQKAFDETARKIALQNADTWEQRVGTVTEAAKAQGTQFTSITTLSPEMQAFMAGAAGRTWKTWIEQLEAQGHPAKATAALYAHLIQAEGGSLPEGVAAYLGL